MIGYYTAKSVWYLSIINIQMNGPFVSSDSPEVNIRCSHAQVPTSHPRHLRVQLVQNSVTRREETFGLIFSALHLGIGIQVLEYLLAISRVLGGNVCRLSGRGC